MQGGSTHTLGGLPRTHLVVDIGLTLVTPGRKVNIAEDQRVSGGFMVLEHVGIDVTTAVDLRLGVSVGQGSAPTCGLFLGQPPTHLLPVAYLIARQTHPVLLEFSTVLTGLGHVQACFRNGADCRQMGTPRQWCHSVKHGLGG